jgi:hypothetical protein
VLLQKNCTEDAAALQVLGISFEDLGVGIAQSWGFPRLIVSSMRRLPAGSIRRSANPEDRLRVLSALSNELCMVIADTAADQQAKELRRIAMRFGDAVALDEEDLRRSVDKSLQQVAQFARSIQLNLQQTRFGRQLKAWGGAASGPALVTTASDTLNGTVLAEVIAEVESDASLLDELGDFALPDEAASEVILLAGIQEVSNALVNDFKLNDVLRITLETIYRAKGFQRVILCIREPRSNSMLGRFGFGPDALEIARSFRFSLVFTPDIFHAALANSVDILISDTNDPKISARIPEWFRKAVAAETFVVFPLCLKNGPVAMIYADRARAGEIVISEKELSLLRTLRNQAVLAIKQSV